MDNLRIATYNIRMETPEDCNDLWRDRKENVMKIIQGYDFDIVGLQEAKESQLSDLRKMDHFGYFGQGRSNDEGNEYNPIFYKKDKLELMEFDTFWLSETLKFEEKAKRWDADCPRICTWGYFRIKASGKHVYVFNTHFDHKSENARYYSADLLNQKISQKSEDTPVFITGDFNGESTERFYQIITSTWKDAVRTSSHHVGPKVTCTGQGFNHELSWDKYQSIDYIFTNKATKIKKTAVITDRFNGRYPSDHFPIYVDTTLI
ncbi:endonuclease/exonuclease/phosphatase family protein [Fredinandcohnia humi]